MMVSTDMPFKCDMCQTEIKEVMTLVDMKTKVCSVNCLAKATNGQEKLVITYPLNPRKYQVHKLNRYNNIEEKKSQESNA